MTVVIHVHVHDGSRLSPTCVGLFNIHIRFDSSLTVRKETVFTMFVAVLRKKKKLSISLYTIHM